MAKKKPSSKKKPTPEEKRQTVLKTYIALVKKLKRSPTEAELQSKGVTRHAVRWSFGNPIGLKEAARKADPEAFKNIIDETLFTPENFKKLEQAAGKYKKFVVTSAVVGCPIHKKFYQSLKSYCEKNKALLLIIPVADPASKAGWDLDSALAQEQIVFGDLALNSNLYISGIKMSAKQIDPTTGLGRLSRNSSFIFGSPKMRMKVHPNSHNKLPHVSMGTGAITIPDYMPERYMSERTAYIANFDHKFGAIVVELDKNEMYHFRQLQAEPKTGNFVDIGDYYKPNGEVSKMYAEAFLLGDWHSGDTDPTAKKAWKEVVDLVKPKKLILEDLFNGKSISHHESNKVITKAIRAKEGQTNMEAEFKITGKDLDELVTWTEEGCVVTKSNHDDFIPRYLEDGRWVKDYENFDMATELARAMLRKQDPVRVGVEKFIKEETKKKVLWLERDQDYRIAGIECGAHGDKGPNGSRGTLENHEKMYGVCSIAHSHTPGILRDAWQAGTSTYLDLEYNQGGSSWMHSSILHYPNGARQLINSIGGRWRKK